MRDDVIGRANVEDTPELTAYYKDLERFETGALWTVANKIEPWEPKSSSVPVLWRYKDLRGPVLRSVELEFEYRKLDSKAYEARRVRPFHIACLENQWYVFAEDLARKQLRTFALPRMRRVRLTSTRFRRPANFSIAKVLSGSFGVFEGGKKHRIQLQFDAFAARLVSERTWHDSQRFRAAKDGSATLEMELGGLEEIERWVLSWGSHVQVLAPTALIVRVREEAVRILRAYGA